MNDKHQKIIDAMLELSKMIEELGGEMNIKSHFDRRMEINTDIKHSLNVGTSKILVNYTFVDGKDKEFINYENGSENHE